MANRVLGFDPGLANTGWGVIDADTSRLVPVAYGSITTPPDISAGARLDIIFSESEKIIKKYKPDAAGMESLYFSKNVTSAIPVAQARGILFLSLFRNGIDVEEYTPQQIKQGITGNGRSGKLKVQEMIRILLGLKNIPEPDHAADALGAAICCFNTKLLSSRGVLRNV